MGTIHHLLLILLYLEVTLLTTTLWPSRNFWSIIKVDYDMTLRLWVWLTKDPPCQTHDGSMGLVYFPAWMVDPRNLQQDPLFTDPKKPEYPFSSTTFFFGVRWDSVPATIFDGVDSLMFMVFIRRDPYTTHGFVYGIHNFQGVCAFPWCPVWTRWMWACPWALCCTKPWGLQCKGEERWQKERLTEIQRFQGLTVVSHVNTLLTVEEFWPSETIWNIF